MLLRWLVQQQLQQGAETTLPSLSTVNTIFPQSSTASVTFSLDTMAFFRSATIIAFFALQSASAFAPTPEGRAGSSLDAINMNKVGTSVVAGAYLFANVMTAAPAFAAQDEDLFGSSQVIAGRSGGRAGGRSRSSSFKSAPTSYKSSPTVIKKTTVIQQAPVMVAPPPVYGGGYGYGGGNSGLGLAIGLNAVSSIGEGMREARQESEIRESRQELTNARIKEAELEARLRQLEASQQRQ